MEVSTNQLTASPLRTLRDHGIGTSGKRILNNKIHMTTKQLIADFLERNKSPERLELLVEKLAYELPASYVEEIIASVETSAVERGETKFLNALLR